MRTHARLRSWGVTGFLLFVAVGCGKKSGALGDGSSPPASIAECGIEATRARAGQADPDVPTSNGMALQSDGKIVRADHVGERQDNDQVFELSRFNADGTLDVSFGANGYARVPFYSGFGAEADSVKVQPDAKIVVAGTAVTYYLDEGEVSPGVSEYQWSSVVAVARLNADGSLDSGFGQGGIVTSDAIGSNCPNNDPDGNTALDLQPDGKILVTPSFTDTDFPYLTIRLLPSGAADPSFGAGGVAQLATLPNGANETPFVTFAPTFVWTSLQPDGKLLEGKMTMQGKVPNETFGMSIIRWTAAGALDAAFANHGELDIPLGATFASGGGLFAQADGKFLADWPLPQSTSTPMLGGYTNGDGSPAYASIWTGGYGLARFNADGTPDATFGVNGGESFKIAGNATYVGAQYTSFAENWQGLSETSDGHLIVGGWRLNPDGSPDASYAGDTLVMGCGGGYVHANANSVLPNGQILLNGDSIERLNADGTLDLTFGLNGFATVHPLPKAPVASGAASPAFGKPLSSEVLSNSSPNDLLDTKQTWYGGQFLPTDLDDFKAIGALDAWKSLTDCSDVAVAILDDGVDTTHPDLAPNLLPGWNFVDDHADVSPDAASSDCAGCVGTTTHEGTALAGIVGAAGNNGQGITGICWKASILPIKVLSRAHEGYLEDAVAGIRYAVDQGARILVIGWSVRFYDQAFRDAIAYAESRGALVVTTGGRFYPDNPWHVDSSFIDPRPVANYPADFGAPNVISVGALDATNQSLDASNQTYASGFDDVAAPSLGVLSTFPMAQSWDDCPGTGESGSNGVYTPDFVQGYCVERGIFGSNSRFAAAFAAGAAALIWARDPMLTFGQVKELIRSKATLAPGGVALLNIGASLAGAAQQ